MMVFPKALFFVIKFPEIVKNSIFRLICYHKLNDFLKISQDFVLFLQTGEKLTHGMVNFLKNILK